MTVRVPKVDASPPTARVDLGIFQGTRPASIQNASAFNAVEDRIEFRITHMKGIVVALEPVSRVKVQGQRVVHHHRREMPCRSGIGQTKDTREKLCRCFLIVCGHNGVIQGDGHKKPPACRDLPRHSTALPRGNTPDDRTRWHQPTTWRASGKETWLQR